MPPLPPPQLPKPRRGLIVVMALVIVALAAAVVVLLVTRTTTSRAGSAATSTTPASGTSTVADPTATVASPGSSATTVGPGSTVEARESQPVTVTGSALPALPRAGATDPAIGDKPPVLNGYDPSGAPISIALGGSPKMVVFLSHWVAACDREVARLVQWKASGTMPAGLEVIGITTGVDKNGPNFPPSKWLQDRKWPWPVLADSADDAAAKAYAGASFPYFVVIGADGTVKSRFVGEVEVAQLQALVTSALNG